MANTNVRGLVGFNPSSGTARLLAAYEDDIVNVVAGTGYGLNLNTTNDVEFEKFLDRVFIQNYSNRPLIYRTSTNLWTPDYVGRTMIAKYIKKFKSRLYLGYCGFIAPQPPLDTGSASIVFPSRVFHSDLFQGNTLTWGIDWGTNGKVVAGTRIFDLDQPLVQDFTANNIKVGDPLFITSGNAQLASERPFLVTKVDSAHRLIVDRDFPVTATSLHFWVGSNWFDVEPDDGDVITALGANSTRLLISKLLSLHYYTGSQRQPVQGAVGTSYNRSIINDRFGNTYYFHGSDPKITGIYKYNGVSSVKVSRAIDPWILAMATASYDNVVAWAEGNELRWFLGNLSANNYIDAINNVVASLNVDTGAWSIDPIADTITCATPWRTANEEDTYCGTSSSQVLQMDDGNTFKTTPISALVETKVYYPAGSEIVNEYPFIQIISRNARGVKVKYKLWDRPIGNQRYSTVDKEWWSLGQLEDDLTEFPLSNDHNQSSGIQFRFDDMSSQEKDAYIEKISIFYRPNRSRLL